MRAKTANQQRSQEKRDRILGAMDTLLADTSFNKITIAKLAQQAEVSPATIYQRFNNKDATSSILLELYYQRVEEWAIATIKKDQKSAKPGLFNALLMIGQSAWDQVNALQHIMRPAYLVSRLKPELLGEDWDRLEKMSFAGFQGFLTHYETEINHQELEKAAGVLSFFFNFMTVGKLLHSENESWELIHSRGDFSHELALMAYGYLAGSIESEASTREHNG